jgi:hypothetical protein
MDGEKITSRMDLKASLHTIEDEVKWLGAIIDFRFTDYFKQNEVESFPEAPLLDDESYYSSLISKLKLSIEERILIIIALVPHIKPAVLDSFFTKNVLIDRVYTEFGGMKGEKHSGIIPTAQTAAFIIGGADLSIHMKIQKHLRDESSLAKENILRLGHTAVHEPIWGGELVISEEFLMNVTLNERYLPRFSPTFPAHRLTTKLEWGDAVLDPKVSAAILKMDGWLQNEVKIMDDWGLGKYLKKGFRALFYGPPGTGKSMTVALLGKRSGREVYRVDLSSVVSKYIGETEKNLAQLFDMAENKDWILFFDEADALFGSRSSGGSSNDMFANQQVAYLLQRVEDYNGLVILASNFKDNIDAAFLRRFQSMVFFPKPNRNLRLAMWEKYFKVFDTSVLDLEAIADKYEISGGGIINVLRYCSISAAKEGSILLKEKDIKEGIESELVKQGITI